MIELIMTGICEDCDKAELYLWDSDQSAFIHNWHVACKYDNICKRVKELLEAKGEKE